MAKEETTAPEGVAMTNEQLMAQLNELVGIVKSQQTQIEKLKNPGVPEKIDRSKTHTRTLRVYDDKLVIAIGQVKTNYQLNSHDPNALQLPITVVDLNGKEEKLVVPYRPFMEETPKVMCKLIKQDITTKEVTDITEGGGGRGRKLGMYKSPTYGMDVYGGPTDEIIEYTVTKVEVEEDIEVIQGEFKGKVFHFTNETRAAINA